MSNLEYNFGSNEILNYYLPAKSECCYLDSEWGAYFSLSNFTADEFVFILLSLMLENSIVFFSKNQTILSTTMFIINKY